MVMLAVCIVVAGFVCCCCTALRICRIDVLHPAVRARVLCVFRCWPCFVACDVEEHAVHNVHNACVEFCLVVCDLHRMRRIDGTATSAGSWVARQALGLGLGLGSGEHHGSWQGSVGSVSALECSSCMHTRFARGARALVAVCRVA